MKPLFSRAASLIRLARPGHIVGNLKKANRHWERGGLDLLLLKLSRRPLTYQDWRKRYGQLSVQDIEGIRKHIGKLPQRPLLTLILPVSSQDRPEATARTINSILHQLYTDWELLVVAPEGTDFVNHEHPQIRNITSTGVSLPALLNSALGCAKGVFSTRLAAGDVLTPHSLYLIAHEINGNPGAKAIYSDDEAIDPRDSAAFPHFKPAWNPDLFHAQNYVGNSVFFQTRSVQELQGYRESTGACPEYDLLLRICEKGAADTIRRIPFILRSLPAVTAAASNETARHEAELLALRDHFARIGCQVTVEAPAGAGTPRRIRYPLPSRLPKVSLIVGTRDRLELLRNVVDGLRNLTDYPDWELIIVNNQSSEPETLEYFRDLQSDARIRVLDYNHPFNFSALNNWGVQQSRGEVIGLLNNDLKMIKPDWLSEMVSHALRPEVGAVGARLLYPDDRLQHCGVVLGIGGVAGHAHKFFDRNHPGYMKRAISTQCFSAVTGACLLLRRAVFEEIGGLDQKNLAVAFNDVDFCLKIREKGYRIILTPYAELYHLESASRGADNLKKNLPRFLLEATHMQVRWNGALNTDPFYNPNLSHDREDFSFAFPPEIIAPWRQGHSAE